MPTKLSLLFGWNSSPLMHCHLYLTHRVDGVMRLHVAALLLIRYRLVQGSLLLCSKTGMLSNYTCQIHRRCLPWISLIVVEYSPWRQVFQSSWWYHPIQILHWPWMEEQSLNDICFVLCLKWNNSCLFLQDAWMFPWQHRSWLGWLIQQLEEITAPKNYLIKSSQDFLTVSADAATTQQKLQDITIKCETTSMHQSAKWCMRATQSSFVRLKDTLSYKEHGEWNKIVTCLLILYNIRAHLVQIGRVYMNSLNMDAYVEYVPWMLNYVKFNGFLELNAVVG